MADESPDQGGPSEETLQRLKDLLPGFKRAMQKRRILGRGKPARIKRPTKVCPVCEALHGEEFMGPGEDSNLTPAPCDRCRKLLDGGMTALVHGHDFAFIKFKDISNYDGRILPISETEMAELKRRMGQTTNLSDENPPSAP